jgi:hypothetical protein
MTDERTRRLRELAVSFFAGDAWVKRSDMLAMLDTEGDRLQDEKALSRVDQSPHVPSTGSTAQSATSHGPTIQEWQRTQADHYGHGWIAGASSSCRCICHSYPKHGDLQDALEALKWHQEQLAKR